MSTHGSSKHVPVGIFAGSDLSTHLLVSSLVPALVEDGYRPHVFLPAHKSARRAALPELRELAFYERAILSTVIFPFLDGRDSAAGAKVLSPAQIGTLHRIPVVTVEDINSAAFLESLKAAGIEAGISIRCYQKFGGELIRQFYQNGGCLWNLHPGILPRYRGVMTIFWSLLEAQDQVSYTLHVVDENWDAGPLIALSPVPLHSRAAMLSTYCDLAPSGVPMIMSNLNQWRTGIGPMATPQSGSEACYHTFPTREDLDAFLGQGLRLVDPVAMRESYLSWFSVAGTLHYRELAERIDAAIDAFECEMSSEAIASADGGRRAAC